MKSITISLFIFFVNLAIGQNEMLTLPQSDFDSPDCCWRRLDIEKKYAESAALLEKYIKNSPNATNKHSLHWHAGQMFAAAGDNKKAVSYMKKTFNLFYRWFGGKEGRQWYFYAKGTVAFVKKNRRQMERMIRLWHKNKLPEDENLRELNKLLSNWELSYDKAY